MSKKSKQPPKRPRVPTPMVPVRVEEARDIVLDWMVEKAEKQRNYIPAPYSTELELSFPLIQHYKVDLFHSDTVAPRAELRSDPSKPDMVIEHHGATSIQAAMRCIVQSKLGPVVQVPVPVIEHLERLSSWLDDC